jgi:hypothetical protein
MFGTVVLTALHQAYRRECPPTESLTLVIVIAFLPGDQIARYFSVLKLFVDQQMSLANREDVKRSSWSIWAKRG